MSKIVLNEERLLSSCHPSTSCHPSYSKHVRNVNIDNAKVLQKTVVLGTWVTNRCTFLNKEENI